MRNDKLKILLKAYKDRLAPILVIFEVSLKWITLWMQSTIDLNTESDILIIKIKIVSNYF